MKKIEGIIVGMSRSGWPFTTPYFLVETKFGCHSIHAGPPLDERSEEDTKRRREYQSRLDSTITVEYRLRLFKWLFGAKIASHS